MLDVQTHYENAVALLRQHRTWCAIPLVDGYAMRALEQRLHMHLHVLGSVADDESPTPDDDELAVTVWLSSRLQSRSLRLRQHAANLACEWLAEEPDSPSGRGAIEALSLYRSPETDSAISQHYRNSPSIRSELIRIWHSQGATLPRALLNQGELHGFDTGLQAAVLEYAADQETSGDDIFRYYYQPLLSSPGHLPHSDEVLCAAIRGGIIRGDGEALVALRRVIEVQGDTESLEPWLHLAALSGAAEFFPVLQHHARTRPQDGFYLLALWGRKPSVTELINGLKDPRTSNAAADAWHWMTAQKLPRIPRLSLVGEETETSSSGDDDHIADAAVAEAWWQEYESLWPDDERWIFGKPMKPSWLATLACDHAGCRSMDFVRLLGATTRNPVLLNERTWFERRPEILGNFILPELISNHQPVTVREEAG